MNEQSPGGNLPPQHKPADHIIWRTSSALQFSLKPGKPVNIESQRGSYIGTDKGCVFLVAAKALGKNKYDWANKISFKLGEHEISRFRRGLKGDPQKFFHDTNKGREGEGELVKTVNMAFNDEQTKIFINVSMKKHGEVLQIPGIAIDRAEADGIHHLLGIALGRVLGWSKE